MTTSARLSNPGSRPAPGPWVLRPRAAAGARFRLFCFPYAGVGPSIYRPWLDLLPSEIEARLVQLPAREGRWREPALRLISDIAPAVTAALRAELGGSFAFYGHSLGALIAFEVTRQLRAAGAPLPAHLFVAAHRAPHLPNPHPPIRHFADEEFVAEVRRRYDGIPQAVLHNLELLELMLPCLRADFNAYETYEYAEAPPLACPISAFGGESDAYVSAQELAGWRDQTTARFRLRMVPGNHFFAQTQRHRVIQGITEDLLQPLGGMQRVAS